MGVLILIFIAIVAGQPNCLEDRYGSSTTCTSNAVDQDIYVSNIGCPADMPPMNCSAGQHVLMPLVAEIFASAATKYDIGINMAIDGGDAVTGQCSIFILTPITTDTGLLNVSSGVGPYWDADSDVCGDIRATDGTNTIYLGYVNVTCQDTLMTGDLSVNTCISWRNSAGPVCNAADEAVPGSPALCVCNTFQIANVTVLYPPTSAPTAVPTAVPTSVPTAMPTHVPTAVPTAVPTNAPTDNGSSVLYFWPFAIALGVFFLGAILFCCTWYPVCRAFDPFANTYYYTTIDGKWYYTRKHNRKLSEIVVTAVPYEYVVTKHARYTSLYAQPDGLIVANICNQTQDVLYFEDDNGLRYNIRFIRGFLLFKIPSGITTLYLINQRGERLLSFRRGTPRLLRYPIYL